MVPGVVSPDGSAAAVIVLSPSPVLMYFDLRTGAESVLRLAMGSAADPAQSLVWSPDSRWLFALDAVGGIQVVDARTRQVTDFRDLASPLPSLTQLAIR